LTIDLIGLVREALTPEAVSKLSATLGEPQSGTLKALEGGVPAILAGMLAKTSTGGGLSNLLSLCNAGVVDGGLLRNFSAMLNGSGAAAVMDFGHGVVEKIFGDKSSAVADALSSQSGVRPASAMTLLGMAGPLAIGAISKASGPQGVTVSSLLSILSSQRETIASYVPPGMGAILGAETLAPVSSAAPATAPAEKNGLGRYWPLWVLLAAVVIAGLIWSFGQETAPLATVEPAKTGTAVKVAVSPAVAALGEFSKQKLPNGVELNIPELGIENKLLAFITGPHPVDKETWFDFDRLLFDTASATLQPSSQEQLDNIANILKAYPKVHVKIGGYTDNVGDRGKNLTLSRERARNVMASLVSSGVAASRLTAEGYGEIHPVADNTTEEGRAKNRRISLRVTAK
jgi:outer membrane protein OmpA-like peptidoglycan-associated protein